MKLIVLLFTILFASSLFGQMDSTKQMPYESFLPKGYVVSETVKGNLNKDGVADCVLMVKATDKEKIVQDEHQGQLDRNRRGLIVLFNKKGRYELAFKNMNCFSSEFEDGGVYFPPELSIVINKNNLYVKYGHGRYGYWQYTFRYKDSDFQLIGYDLSSNRGPITNSKTSINFLTKTKQVNLNINENLELESGEEIFKKTITKIKAKKLIQLSEISDFDELDIID